MPGPHVHGSSAMVLAGRAVNNHYPGRLTRFRELWKAAGAICEEHQSGCSKSSNKLRAAGAAGKGGCKDEVCHVLSIRPGGIWAVNPFPVAQKGAGRRLTEGLDK